MSQINRTELLKGMRDDAKIQNAESIPTQLAEKVVPVLEVNPRLLFCINWGKEITASAGG